MLLRSDIFLPFCQAIHPTEAVPVHFQIPVVPQYPQNVPPVFPCSRKRRMAFFHNGEHLFPVCEHLVQIPSLRDLFAPASADVDAVTICIIFNCMERTLADTPSTVVAGIFVNDNLAVHHFRHLNGQFFFQSGRPCSHGTSPDPPGEHAVR